MGGNPLILISLKCFGLVYLKGFFKKKKLERGVISAIKFEATRIHFSGDFFVVVVVVVA